MATYEELLHLFDNDLDIIRPYLKTFPQRRPYSLRDRTNPLEVYDEVDFRMRFRMSKHVFLEILDNIQNSLISHTRNRSRILLPVQQLCIALRFYASGSD